ncbi:MAG: hypothetical protein L3J87_02365 [Thermoplasmata archaeon]|nr:hypothetical protein [Thermoplasmata archaeon]
MNATTAGVVSWHGTKHLVDDINATLVSTHSYYLQLFVYGIVFAETGPGSNNATASLNLGTGGNQAKLVSVTMT